MQPIRTDAYNKSQSMQNNDPDTEIVQSNLLLNTVRNSLPLDIQNHSLTIEQ